MARGISTNFREIHIQVEKAVHNPMDLDWERFHTQYKMRIFFVNIGTEGQDIGAEPTRMYETKDMRNDLCIDRTGIITKEYYEQLEEKYGIIFDPDAVEIDIIASEWADKAISVGYSEKGTC